MKTIKQIQEGFFSNTGAGADTVIADIIKKYGIRVKELKTLNLIPIPANMIQISGKNIIITIKYDENTGEDTRIFADCVHITTNEKNIPFEICIDTGSKRFCGALAIKNCPNLENVDFASKSIDIVSIDNCGGSKGVDISGLGYRRKLEIIQTSISNFGNIKLDSQFEMRLNQETLNNTNFENFPSSNTTKLIINSTYRDIIGELNLRNVPVNQKEVIVVIMPSILGDIDLGFKNLIIGNRYDKSKDIPKNLKEWLMTTDLKGTIITFRSKSKGVMTKIGNILNSVKKKRPEISHLLEV